MTKRELLRPVRGFVELMARSNFSFLQGASHPEEMVEQAVRLNYDGIALCDLNGLYGVARGFQTAHAPSFFAASIKPKDHFRYVIGTEVVLTDQSQLVLVPSSKRAYSQLCQLLTQGKRLSAKGFSKISLDDVKAHSDEMLAFALPPLSAEKFLALQDIFQDRLYLPVWRDLTWESQEFCEQALELEQKYHAELFVTQRPFMHSPSRKPLFDVLTCIHHQKTLLEAKDTLIQNAERYLRPLEDLAWLWQDRLDLVEKTVDIVERVHFSLDEIRYQYPESKLPPGMNRKEYFRSEVQKGLLWRFPAGASATLQKSVDHEIDIISDLQYEDYFLTLYEICSFAKDQGILFQGRGSAANSVVCYALGLTNVDPTQIDLLFERFISRERGEPPDIDIDFEHERREEVIQHIYQKYDPEHAAMVCTVIRFKARMALREAAKVFGIPLKTVNAMIRFMGRDGLRRLVEDPLVNQRFHIDEHTWALLLTLAQELRGFPRHLGIHSGGFLITHERITDIVPVEKATMTGRYVIQWNKDDVALLKLMKIDILSLGMLSALRKCLTLLKQKKGKDWNLAQIPPDDPATYDMICRAETVGVFQIESRAQMNTLPRLQPRCFYDLVVEVALVRPGPLQGGMVHPYLRRRQGLEAVQYPHDALKAILEKTMGVPIFQEQVMRIAMVAAGFTPGEADELRRVMSSAWRKKVTMDGIQQRILNGFHQYGLSQTYADQIYKVIEGFANYGFPESHAASFALLTYASSYFKCHHPEIFVCALLNSQPMGFYPPRSLIAEAQKNGVLVLPLDIQNSLYDYNLEGPQLALRVGWRALHSLPESLLRSIETNRQNHGQFQSLADLIHRLQPQRSHLAKLAASGALHCFEPNTRKLLWEIESLSLDPQSYLWGQPKEKFSADASADEVLPFESQWDLLSREYSSHGFSVDHHPLSVLRPALDEKNISYRQQKYVPFTDSKQIQQSPQEQKVRVAGLVGITQRPPTAKGMCFITLEDEFGFINIVIHPDVYQKDRLTIYSKSLLEIWGRIERKGPIINIKAEKVLPLQIS